MQASLGMRFIAAVITEDQVHKLLEYGRIGHLFSPTELPVYEFVTEFAKHYGKLPALETVAAHTDTELGAPDEKADYYHDLLVARYIERELKRDMKAAAELSGTEGKDPHGALDKLRGCVANLLAQQRRSVIADFRDAYDLIMGNYVAKYHQESGTGLR